MRRRPLAAAVAAAFALAVLLAAAGPALAGLWSSTRPAINETHVFAGEINRRGKPVGFHARPGGEDPRGARVVEVLDGPNALGVYVARVEIRDRSGRWLGKTSSFFPDRLSRGEVVAAILHAWEHRTTGGGERGRRGAGGG